MQFQLVCHHSLSFMSCATIFDPAAARAAECVDSNAAAERFDDPQLAASSIAYDSDTEILKFQFFINERPDESVTTRARRTFKGGHFHSVSGTLCAGWEGSGTKDQAWIYHLPHAERDGFEGDFANIEPGDYHVDMYDLAQPYVPEPPKPRWRQLLEAAGCLAVLGLIAWFYAAPIVVPILALIDWNGRDLYYLLPHVLFFAILALAGPYQRRQSKRMATEYQAQSADVLIVLTSLPKGSALPECKPSYLIHVGDEARANSRTRHRERMKGSPKNAVSRNIV